MGNSDRNIINKINKNNKNKHYKKKTKNWN